MYWSQNKWRHGVEIYANPKCRLPEWLISSEPFSSGVERSDWMESSVAPFHYDGVIMTTMASQITSLTVVCSTVYWDANQRKHQSSASLAFVWGIHRDRWIHRTKSQLRGKCFHLMTSSWLPWFNFNAKYAKCNFIPHCSGHVESYSCWD